jgi:hypothetical protein
MNTAELLLKEIEAWLRDHDMTETRFSVESCGDRNAVRSLRARNSITTPRMDQMRAYMRNFKPPKPVKRKPTRRGAEVTA